MKWPMKMILLILGAWLFTTVLVDFFAIPAVFQNVSKRFEAGMVGMSVFSRFNTLEILFALGLIISLWCSKTPIVYKKAVMVFSFILLGLAVTYKFYMTPAITEINLKMRNEINTVVIEALEKEHQLFHSLYVKLDSAKLFILMGMIILLFVNKERKRSNL